MEKLGKPRNWVKLGIIVGKVRVEKTTKHIIIHTGQIAGVHPNHAIIEAGSIIGSILGFLKTHGVVLDDVGLPLRKPIFKFYTPEAETLYKLYGVTVTGDGMIDSSPPDKLPHEEYHRNAAVRHLEMPNRVMWIEKRQVSIEQKITNIEKRLVAAIEKITVSLEKLTQTFESLTKPNPLEKTKTRPKDLRYVS